MEIKYDLETHFCVNCVFFDPCEGSFADQFCRLQIQINGETLHDQLTYVAQDGVPLGCPLKKEPVIVSYCGRHKSMVKRLRIMSGNDPD